MTRLKFLYIIIAIAFSSCSKDFLDRPSLSQIDVRNFYTTAGELRWATSSLYGGSMWADWNYNCYLPIGEVMSGNMSVGWWDDASQLRSFTLTGMNGILVSEWKTMYKVIAHCNYTINNIKQYSSVSISDKEKNAALAEAKFIRAYAYYNLALLWKDVPIIENTDSLVSKPLVFRNKVDDVYQFAINDLDFAVNHLPKTDVAGRLTTWSAQGLLGKLYLTLAGLNPATEGQRNQALLDSAAKYAGNVCKKSGLQLMANYADQFKTENNDNQESLFALQWAAGGDWLEGNMLQIYSTAKEISANGQAGWYSILPTLAMYKLYTPKDTLRRKATFMIKGDYYPELNRANGGFKFVGSCSLKKHIIGTAKDNKAPLMTQTSSVEHNSLLRLADIYLIYAEAVLGNKTSTTDPDALLYFNKVRKRAGVSELSSLNMDILFLERRIELAAEGQYWNDLVRLSYFDVSKAVSLIYNDSETRSSFTFDENGVIKPEDKYQITAPTAETFRFPIPSVEITANSNLSLPPVRYNFNKK